MWRPSISNCVWSTLLLAIFVQQTLAQRTPTISYITQEQIKDIGGTVEFDCSVQYAKEYNVLFLKTDSDPVFLSTGSTLVIKDSRFSLRYDPNSSTYKLQIKDIQETDAGTYTCQSVVASEGSEVQMECYASGYPTPTITWRRENNAILPTGEFPQLFVGDYLGLRWVRWLSQLSFGGARFPLLSLPLCSLSPLSWLPLFWIPLSWQVALSVPLWH
ncbi:GD10889 [Drosophila simulans]|uniref:GD10889 n=1 Tax=Drosophila simulans TaxID=7240 RepID=B4QCW9_DROSI|nr:GD10889 [Drosophila simulans]